MLSVQAMYMEDFLHMQEDFFIYFFLFFPF